MNPLKEFRKNQFVNESKRMLSIQLWRRRLLFWGGGLFCGLVCVLFAISCEAAYEYFLHFERAHPWIPLITIPVGFVLINIIMRHAFLGTEGSGIPQVIAALEYKDSAREKLVSLRIAFGKFVLTVMGFACGASLGREGPTIQLSASVMQSLQRWGSFHRHDADRGLLLAGGAAGIAAAFNAPLAGIVFAIEELSGSFEKGLSGTIITVVVFSGIVAQAMLGHYVYFGTSTATLASIPEAWVAILSIGIIGGALGGIFSFGLIILSSWVKGLKGHVLAKAAIIGLMVALIGVLSGGWTYGSGYEAAKCLISGEACEVSIWYAPLKMLATLLTYLSGIPGGIFAPSLSTGAGLGYIVAGLFEPELFDVIVLLSTVAYFSGVVQSPITSFVIVMEMTGSDGKMLLPIMITALIAKTVSRFFCREPLYHILAARYKP